MTEQSKTGAGRDADRGEANRGSDAPELHNSEQDDEQEQTQSLAEEALHGEAHRASPLDSTKNGNPGEVMDDASQDLIDHMRDMEQSGRIDMDAYRGEPNMDDNEDKFGPANKLDEDLPGDGSGERSQGSRV